MSRSNPSQTNSHPCTRWMEWDGANGGLRYYDRDKKENVAVPLPTTFILLDKVAVVNGWHDASNSGITSNEVRDTTREPLLVKAFKGPVLAQGLYRDIRERVATAGGNFFANLYTAYKNGDNSLHIGSIKFKGAALNAWVEFEKANRRDVWEKAVVIKGCAEGKKGKVVFKTPVFGIVDISPETNEQATKLDRQLQEYLVPYMKRSTTEQAEVRAEATPQPEPSEEAPAETATVGDVPW